MLGHPGESEHYAICSNSPCSYVSHEPPLRSVIIKGEEVKHASAVRGATAATVRKGGGLQRGKEEEEEEGRGVCVRLGEGLEARGWQKEQGKDKLVVLEEGRGREEQEDGKKARRDDKTRGKELNKIKVSIMEKKEEEKGGREGGREWASEREGEGAGEG